MDSSKRYRVLIVEDDPSIRMLMRWSIEKEFDVVDVGGASAAVGIASESQFDLFLLDINLGMGMNGVDLLTALRAQPHHAHTPAVACTALTSAYERGQIIAAGFEGFLPKPFFKNELVEALRAVLPRVDAVSPSRSA